MKANDRKVYVNNKSGFKGVYWYKKLNKWVSRITVDSKKIHLGYFDNIEEAKRSYDFKYEETREIRKGVVKHGMYGTKTHRAWAGMRNRCYNQKQDNYYLYGGRGICVCERWLNSFENFISDMGECPLGKSLERLDNNGNYDPNNCSWATSIEQANNKRSNRKITAFGKEKTLAEWSRETGLGATTITGRIDKCGWSPEKSLSIKKRGRAKNKRPVAYTGIEEKLGIVHSRPKRIQAFLDRQTQK